MAVDKDTYSSNPNIKKPGVKINFTEDQVREYIKCVKDPVHFIRTYVKIISLDHGIIPFEMWDWQEDLVRSYHENRFVISLIGRQSGKTQTTTAYLLWCILFNENFTAAILANKHSTSIEIMERLKTSYELLPLWLQQGVISWNKTSIELENGSRTFSNSTSPAAIRGFAINLIFLDEFAIVPDHIQEEFFRSVFPTISSGKTTKVFITSTPSGMNKFHEIWIKAKRKANDFKPIEIHYSKIPGRDENWREKQIEVLGERGFAQEFGTEFLGSSSTLISGSKLQMLEGTQPDPIHETNDGLKFFKPAERGILQLMKAMEEVTIEAAVTGNYGTALQAFTLNPLIPSGNIARTILNEMLVAHKKHLPQFADVIAKIESGEFK